MTSEVVRPDPFPASAAAQAGHPPRTATYRTGWPPAAASGGGPGRVAALAALAAAETAARLGRSIPVRSIAATVAVDLVTGQADLRELATDRACARLSGDCRPVGRLRQLDDALVVRTGSAATGAARPAPVHLDWAATEAGLTVAVQCGPDDPWRSCLPAVAELYAEVLRELVGDPGLSSSRPAGIGADSRQLLLTRYAGTRRDGGPFRAIPHLVEDMVDRFPTRVAVTCPDRSLSYRQLDRYANGLAARLAAAGVRAGDLVPVLLADGPELPVTYLALLKLGAAFVPVDPRWPAARRQAVCDLLDTVPVLAGAPGQAVPAHAGRVIVVRLAGVVPSARRPAVRIAPDDAIYGVFTSGTTGPPRCAVNRHAGLANRFQFMTRFFQATGDEVVLQNSRHTFDSAVWQLFWPLTTGGRTVLPPAGEFLDLTGTVALIAAERVTMTDFVPSVLNALVPMIERDPLLAARLATLRQLIVGGEEINPAMIRRLRDVLPAVEVTNGYGPTETSIGMVFHRVADADGEVIPLGRPIDNCYAIVVDDRMRPLPPGAVGEIVIGGSCVGAGYFGAPRRTAVAFVPNPFREIPGRRLYRSGDLGRFDERGTLHFAGRRDFQVKINGVRVELGEVTSAAQRAPGVRQAVAILAGPPGNGELALFVVGPNGGGQPDLEHGLRGWLAEQLPRTSRPRHIVVLPALPLTSHGKVDRRRLALILHDRLASAARTAPAATAADLRDLVLAQFRTVLGQPDLPAAADFVSAGGDSLQALSVVEALARATGRPVDVARLFAHPSAEALAVDLGADLTRVTESVEEPETALVRRDAAVVPPVPARAAGTAAHVDPTRPVRVVLLTGATGFLGSQLAYELLSGTGLQVWCGVRAASDAAATQRVHQALRERGRWRPEFAVRCRGFAMDLARPGLGLDPVAQGQLAGEVDLILHNGAMVNFLFDYRAHRPANVTGTAALVELALRDRPKPVHYVSTLGVLQTVAARSGVPVSEEHPLTPDTLPVSGYSRSKWVAERYLATARRLGAVVTVLRLGELMPAADSGHPHRRALTHLLLTAFHRLGVRPDVVVRSDYTPVDYAARRVVASVSDPACWGRTMHVFHPQSVCLADVLSAAGQPIPRVGCVEFLARIDAAADGDRDLALLRRMLPIGGNGVSRYDEPGLARLFSTLLTDNPRLFGKETCRQFEARWGLADRPLREPAAAYRTWLGRHLRPAVTRPVPANVA
ncbi:amino acid adenylation domain-containing protein [Solwaraspora sp. WMMB335]|uniref:amino acid adenylation domain-containing protein n=1 Tax=Solwaraspora sp. WMMB335 TaxID=3404118 RepID=UPI003B96467A